MAVIDRNKDIGPFVPRPDDDLIVIDPEHEFTPLCDGLGGERVEIGESSRAHINALDIDEEDRKLILGGNAARLFNL